MKSLQVNGTDTSDSFYRKYPMLFNTVLVFFDPSPIMAIHYVYIYIF